MKTKTTKAQPVEELTTDHLLAAIQKLKQNDFEVQKDIIVRIFVAVWEEFSDLEKIKAWKTFWLQSIIWVPVFEVDKEIMGDNRFFFEMWDGTIHRIEKI